MTAATSNSFNITPAAVGQLVFGQQPTNVSVGSPFSPAVTVLLEDSFGNVETTDTSSMIAIRIASGTGSLASNSTNSVMVAGGVATFSNLVMNAGGTFTLKASDASPTLTSALSSSFFVLSVTSASVVSDKNGVVDNFVLFNNGTVYQQTGTKLHRAVTPVTGDQVTAIAAGADTSGNADVTILFAPGSPEATAGYPLETHTGTSNTSGWVSLDHSLIASEASKGATIRSFVTGGGSSPALYGVLDVVFTDNTLWQINLANPNAATEINSKVNFVAIGVHGTGSSAVEADYVAFVDNGSTNGGVWQRYGPVTSISTGTWTPITSLDVYAISASQYQSNTADLIVSNRNNAGIIDHSDWAWRGTPNSLTVVAGVAVSSIAIDAAGNDFYILQSTGSLYEHKNGNPITTATVVVTGSSPAPNQVATVLAMDSFSDAVYILFSNGTLTQVTGVSTGTFTQKTVAT